MVSGVDPDPRTAPDDGEDATTPDATNTGVSSQDPAEGSDDAPGGGIPNGNSGVGIISGNGTTATYTAPAAGGDEEPKRVTESRSR